MKRIFSACNGSDLKKPIHCKRVKKTCDVDKPKNVIVREVSPSDSVRKSFTKEYIKDNILVVKFLGSGTYGLVSMVKDKTSDDCFAIKMFRAGKETKEEFFKEVDMLQKSQGNEFIIELRGYCVDETENFPAKFYLFMEYFEGMNIDILSMRSPLKPRQIKSVLYQVGNALKHIHLRGIIHRDIKPSNIMMNEAGRIKLIDFGLADMGPKTSGRSGTVSYMAPEMWNQERKGEYGCEVDYYAVGVVAFELLFGILPFKFLEQSLSELDDSAPQKKRDQLEIEAKLKGLIKYPRVLDEDAMTFLTECLLTNPEARLGDREFLDHAFFAHQQEND